MPFRLSWYSPRHRGALVALSAGLIAAIAIADWACKTYISLGFLYLFPIMILSGMVNRRWIVGVALACACLQEMFSDLPGNEATVRLLFSCVGFLGTGLFFSEMVQNRRQAQVHLEELELQVRLRNDAEEQLRSLVESSPAAIVTLDAEGRVVLANEAAQAMLAPGGQPLPGRMIHAYLPGLQAAVPTQPKRALRTTLQCAGRRADGELFLAGIWFSTYNSLSGARLAAIVVDLTDDLRSREDLSLSYHLKSTRILVSAVAHEVRNLCGAILAIHENLARVPGLETNEDFVALGSLTQSLERVAAMELGAAPGTAGEAVDLGSVLDEFRVLIDAAFRESGIAVEWELPDALPLVWADRYGLIQVFLNLARNSQRGMAATPEKRLRIAVRVESRRVVIRFTDTGVGIAAPENLFRPFQRGAATTGLGLYVSRAIMHSFGGDLSYEPAEDPHATGACFAVAANVGESAMGPAAAIQAGNHA